MTHTLSAQAVAFGPKHNRIYRYRWVCTCGERGTQHYRLEKSAINTGEQLHIVEGLVVRQFRIPGLE